MKQSAVKYLYEKLFWEKLELNDIDFEKAKEMEKQQIIDAFNEGKYENTGYGDSETYYNETFKK